MEGNDTLDDIMLPILGLIALAALYVIIRMIINISKGKDGLDGLL
jgi:hypothetical protein